MASVTLTNLGVITAKRGLDNATSLYLSATERLSSGLRINSAADDPAGFSIAARLNSRIASLQRVATDIQADISLTQTGEDAIGNIKDLLDDIRVLAVSSASGSATTADRQANQTQVNDLVAEINSIANNTEFNSRNLLDGTYAAGAATLTLVLGPDSGDTTTLNIRTMTAAALGVDDVDVSTQSGANSAINEVDSAIDITITEAASVGGKGARLDSADDWISGQVTNLSSAVSGLEDADLAQAAVDQARATILRQTSSAALAQANVWTSNVLNVILPGLS